MRLCDSIVDAVGRTPMVRLRTDAASDDVRLYGKLERCNPMGSVKDRIALSMIDAAERSGALRPGGVVVEPTSGNTGIGLAMICAVRGYHLILTMPETMSVERRRILRGLGSEVVLTPGGSGMGGAVEEAERIAASTPGAFMPDQFDNPANPAAHERTTGPEIWEATQGRVDIVVAGIGTGGTVTGLGRFLRRKKPSAVIVGVEPAESPFLTEGHAGPHAIQGIGAGFRPSILELGVLDEILTVSGGAAAETARRLAVEEGVFVGVSAGAAVAAARRVASRPTSRGATIVVILQDGGERYLTVGLWEGQEHAKPAA